MGLINLLSFIELSFCCQFNQQHQEENILETPRFEPGAAGLRSANATTVLPPHLRNTLCLVSAHRAYFTQSWKAKLIHATKIDEKNQDFTATAKCENILLAN